MTKKIIFVDGLINIAAAQTYSELLKVCQKKADFELVFLTSSEKNAKWPFKDEPVGLQRAWSDNHYVRNLFRFFKEKKPSLVHFFFELRMFGDLNSAMKLPLLLFLLKILNVKVVITLYSPLVVRKNSRWNIVQENPYHMPDFIIKFLAKIFVKSICNFSNMVIVETNSIKSALVDFYGISQNKVEMIRNAVALRKPPINPEKESRLLSMFKGKKIILCFGVFSPRKGQDIAIRAFDEIKDRIPNHVLILAGRKVPEFKDYEYELKQLIKQHDLENRVYDLGTIDNEEIEILFDNASLALYPYPPSIVGSGSFSFALQYNTPSIVSNIITFEEILGHKGALFCQPENPENLAELILKIETDNILKDNLRREMQEISEERSSERIALEHFSIYNKILT